MNDYRDMPGYIRSLGQVEPHDESLEEQRFVDLDTRLKALEAQHTVAIVTGLALVSGISTGLLLKRAWLLGIPLSLLAGWYLKKAWTRTAH